MVSIPAWFDWRLSPCPSKTHTGPVSIPAWFDWRLPGAIPCRLNSCCFNPSLVRLAPVTQCPGAPACDKFQSQLGSIGAPIRIQAALVRIEFQSQLGSIGACHEDWQPRTVEGFQSQLGSIGAHPYGQIHPIPYRFQSQLGSIGASPSPSSTVQAPEVSIPAWFDWRPLLAPYLPGWSWVSIPAWFDWRPPGCPVGYLGLDRFQSQLGSIGARTGSARG